LNNLRVLRWLVRQGGLSDDTKNQWDHHWVRQGLEAFEHSLALLATERQRLGLAPSSLCWGSELTLADCCLVPQIFNAQRFGVPLEGLPLTMAAYEAALALPAVQAAQPSACPDAQP
jgi:glutathione S-transferase